MATSSQEGSDASSSCKKKKGPQRYYYYNFLCSKWSKIHMAHFKGSHSRNAQVVFFHTWCFSWHASKYLLNLSTNSNWYSIFVYQINPVLLWHCTCSTADSPPYFALTNVTSVGGTDSTSCQKEKRKRSSEASVHTNMTASGTSGRFMGWCNAALRFSQIPKGVHRIEMEAILSTLSCSRKHFETTGALWHDTLPGWK